MSNYDDTSHELSRGPIRITAPNPQPRLSHLEAKVSALQDEVAQLRMEVAELRGPTNFLYRPII